CESKAVECLHPVSASIYIGTLCQCSAGVSICRPEGRRYIGGLARVLLMSIMMIEAYNVESVRHVAISDYVELTKPGITMMVCLTTLSGFFIAGGSSFSLLFLHTVFGTALIASGASALNMVYEWQTDGTMRRTKRRPIPAGRMSPLSGLAFG